MSEEQVLVVDVFAEYGHVRELQREMASILHENREILTTVAPDVSKWTACMQLEHICLANKMVTTGLISVIEADADAFGQGNINRLGKVLLRRGFIPRGKAEAPDQYRPESNSSVDSVSNLLHKIDDRLARIGEHLDMIAGISVGFEHPYFGTLPAPAWIRFMHVHSLHHVRIVRDIINHLTSDQ